jgi:hypothetical protein
MAERHTPMAPNSLKPYMRLMAMLLCGTSAVAAAQVIGAEWQLPNWAQPKWRALRDTQPLELSLRINPFVWQGDFDGDKEMDVAFMVRRTSDRKEGIVVLWRSGVSPTVLGVGSVFDGGDDLSWINFWGIEEKGSLQKSYDADTIRLETDALIVSKEESATGLIYFVKGAPHWQQQVIDVR